MFTLLPAIFISAAYPSGLAPYLVLTVYVPPRRGPETDDGGRAVPDRNGGYGRVEPGRVRKPVRPTASVPGAGFAYPGVSGIFPAH